VRARHSDKKLRLRTSAQRARLAGWLVAPALWLAACAVEVSNVQPARDLARTAQPDGSIYTGWRVFQDRCARCHGPSGNGSADAPDLSVTLRTMGPRRFVDAVLRRYDWDLPPLEDADNGTRNRRVEEVLQRRRGELSMPDWQGEPQVTAHIADLYAYLSARAHGTQEPGRPTP
jgi:hypothetical protein